jgi:hypothetical protein
MNQYSHSLKFSSNALQLLHKPKTLFTVEDFNALLTIASFLISHINTVEIVGVSI